MNAHLTCECGALPGRRDKLAEVETLVARVGEGDNARHCRPVRRRRLVKHHKGDVEEVADGGVGVHASAQALSCKLMPWAAEVQTARRRACQHLCAHLSGKQASDPSKTLFDRIVSAASIIA